MLNHEIRRQGIGASQVATILGRSPWETPLALYHYIKHGKMKNDNASMKNGRQQEKVILDAYEAEKHIALERNQQVIDKTCEIFRCNLDGINWPLKLPVEAKTAYERGGWGKAGTECFPTPYQVQCAYQAAIVDAPKVDVAVKFGKDKKIEYFVYNRHKALEKKLRDRVLAWWEKHIVKDVAPEPVNESDAPLLDLVYLDAPDHILSLYEEHKRLAIHIKEAEEVKAKIKEWVKTKTLGKAIIKFPDDSVLGKQYLSTRSAIDVSLLKADNLDVDKYKKTTTSVCFKLS